VYVTLVRRLQTVELKLHEFLTWVLKPKNMAVHWRYVSQKTTKL